MNGWFLELPMSFWMCVAFAFGTCAGSFANVCIYRMPLEMSIIRPGSKCPQCGVSLRWQDNIPLLSWLLLGARCRSCALPISIRYPIVEMLTGVSFSLAVWRIGMEPSLLVYLMMFWSWIVLSGIDWDYQFIPDEINISGMVVGPIVALVAQFAPWPLGLMVDSIWESLLGLTIGGGVIWGIRILGSVALKQEAMGFGDVKLMAFIGSFLGWKLVLMAIFFASLIGSVAGLAIKFGMRRQSEVSVDAENQPPANPFFADMDSGSPYTRIPFGPYLVVGSFIAFLWGEGIWHWYWYDLGL